MEEKMHPNSEEARERERMMRLSKFAQEYVSKAQGSPEREEIFAKVSHMDSKMFWAFVDEYRLLDMKRKDLKNENLLR